MTGLERHRRVAWAFGACLVLTGCGAAYFGTALGIVATQKDRKTIDQSFPDAVPTAPTAPTIVTVELSDDQQTITRDLDEFNPGGLVGAGPVTRTDHVVTGLAFPPGYGEARSNRDAGTTLEVGDRLVIRINGDQARELVFDAAASTGEEVAAAIQAEVAALTPNDADVPVEAYAMFEASWDEVSGSYRFVSGAPGETSEVVFEPTPRQGRGDSSPDETSTITAGRLGLGVAQGGDELAGADTVRFAVINRGTDVVPAGTSVTLYLSRDKVLEPRVDLPVDRLTLDVAVAVGEARAFARRNGRAPPTTLLREDLRPGVYYLLVAVDEGGERVLGNNVLVAPTPVLLSLPFDDPASPDPGPRNDVDLVPSRTLSPIAIVAGANLPLSLTITNLDAAVGAPGIPVDVDLVLSSDDVFDEPGGFSDTDDTDGVTDLVVRINSDDPSRRVTITLDGSGTPIEPVVTSAGFAITVQYDPATHTVADVVTALNDRADTLIDAFTTGSADPDAVLMEVLSDQESTTTGDTFLAVRRVTFGPEPRPQGTQTFVVDGLVRTGSFRKNLLPLKVMPLVRIRPDHGLADPDPTHNNIRRAANFVRIYDRDRATVDSTTGTVLPTVNQDDFAALAAVTQRPVNAGSIRQGQQRVLRFELPPSGLAVEESQLLVILRTSNFDAHMDLLNATGTFITGSDDSGLGKDPVIYTSVQATAATRTFYIVVSTARADETDLAGGGETFELTISINQRQVTDAGLVAATRVPNLVQELTRRLEPVTAERTRNHVLIPFSLTNGKAEVGIVLPQRARVRFATRPLFQVGVETEITGFVGGLVPFPVEHQPVLADDGERIVYRPTGGTVSTSHILDAGVYTFAARSIGGGDVTLLRLEVDAEFIPD